MGFHESTPFAQKQEKQQPVNGVVIEVSNESDVCPQDYAGAAVGTALCGLWGLLGLCCCPSPWGKAGAMLGCTISMALQAVWDEVLLPVAVGAGGGNAGVHHLHGHPGGGGVCHHGLHAAASRH
eukprot:Sspe_Gene.11096::Locus_3739_Transcript_7_10_Confidence_0.400_Length_465::g.11096::m.11096